MTEKEYKELLNSEPFFLNTEEKKKIGMSGYGTLDYIPIQAVYKTIEAIYSNFTSEIVNIIKDGNLLMIVARVHLVHPVTSVKFFVDGVGSGAFKMTGEYNVSHAQGVTLSPKSYTNAIKNAVQKLGKVFGRDLNDTKSFGEKTDVEIEAREFNISEYDTLKKIMEIGSKYKTSNSTVYKLIIARYRHLINLLKTDDKKSIEQSGFNYEICKKEYDEQKTN